jgi:hypothetical protein
MIFASIPNDVLLIIRSYLFIFRLENVAEDGRDELESFWQQEPERSWRQFLAISNSQCWKGVRKELRVWSLNQKSFLKYLTNDLFRQYINEQMINPVLQLNCCAIAVKEPSISSLVADMVAESSIGCIHMFCYRLSELPSSQFLQSMSVKLSSALQRLGDFPCLETLQLRECERLTTVGKMNNLKQLHLRDVDEGVIPQFPLEQLEKLVISGHQVKDFPKFSHRLRSLKELRLDFIIFYADFGNFIAQQYPFAASLNKLHLKCFSDIDLTGLSNLRHLSIVATSTNRISGKDEVYPNLKSFSFSTTPRAGDKIDFFRTQLTNVSEFTFLSTSTVETEPLPLHDSLKSLTLRLRGLRFIDPSLGRSFHKVKLYDSSLPDYSMFSNVRMLVLRDCSTLTDLEPFKNIPYLHLEILRDVNDFSCLGTQRYLKVARCEGLTDNAVAQFGHIYHLCICYCNISVLTGLTHNRFIILESNDSLKEIHLPGQDYIHVTTRCCFNLTRINLTGRVYSLEVGGSGGSMENLKRHCSYLNGQEVNQEQPGTTSGKRK